MTAVQEAAGLAAKPGAARLPPPALFIGGRWVEPEGGRTFPTENPATEEVLCQVASASPADAGRAVEAAHAALAGDWGQKTSARDRGRLLYKIADALEARIDEYSHKADIDDAGVRDPAHMVAAE